MQANFINAEAREWLPSTCGRGAGGEGAKHETTIAANVVEILEA